jgi:ATP-dependent RNA helicase SUPV3L1/SUV3
MSSGTPGWVRAVLGPTNTGKTYLAIDRMLGYASGMIGFPLRLLARENYDRIVAAKGASQVALVTGEEKIIPPRPRWFVCTVEAMPLDRLVDFLAIDEVQLCADAERGHVFTDRLLRARGREETMFLGSDTVAGLIRRLVPGIEIETRPRFSTLSYGGPKKLSRLPRRSAVVAFSVDEVYAIAEQIRRQRGGTAVVLGALSPRTRNAQVEMYQAGEVDYMVATDAIGMGLNMDVDHVAFAGTRKFDGRRTRPLSRAEIGQIAGRAGRHMNDGTFGVTNDLPPLDEETVAAVQSHQFDPVERIFWRNTRLDFASPVRLLKSLEEAPPRPEMIRAREGEDQWVLAQLARDEEVAARAGHPAATRLLWDVCQIPDFRKVTPDHHAELVKQIFLFLRDGPDGEGRLPVDWVAKRIGRLESTAGDIDTLTNRIAHVRTWTYISHRNDWLADAAHWQERTREIEDRLSDALHDRLTHRFVDRRAALIDRRRNDGEALLSAVTAAGDVIVEGDHVGQMAGLEFLPDEALSDHAPMLAAARRAAAQAIPGRISQLTGDGDGSFGLAPDGGVLWRGAAVARLAAGRSPLQPQIEIRRSEFLENGPREAVRARLAAWLDRHLRRRLRPLYAALDAELDAPARGLVYQVSEGLGAIRRRDVRPLLDTVSAKDRKALTALGLRFGAQAIFFPALTRPAAVKLRTGLWAAHAGAAAPEVPPGGDQDPGCLPADLVRRDAWLSLGYLPFGRFALRLDRVERLCQALRKRGRKGAVGEDAELVRIAGCAGEDLTAILSRLGYRVEKGDAGIAYHPKSKPGQTGKRKRPPRPPRRNSAKDDEASPFAALQALVRTR